MTDSLSQEALRRLARQPIYEGIDPARRDEIRRARRSLALQQRLDEGGAEAEAVSLMLHQANYARAWEMLEIWPSDDDEAESVP